MMVISSAFFRGQLRAVAFLELLDRVFALLDHGAEHLQLFFFVEVGALVDALVLQRGFHHAQGREPQLFPLAHGIHHIFLHTFGQAHGVIIG